MDKVKQLINESIDEELCISDEVMFTANKICNAICGEKTFDKTLIYNNPRVHSSINSFNINGIKIACTYYFFNNPKDYKEYMSNVKKEGLKAESFFSHGLKLMFLDAVSISGKVRDEIIESSVMHEVEHLYQQERRGKPFHDDIGNKLYVATEGILKTCREENIRRVAIALYLSFDYEADAYLNELYSDMVAVEPDIFQMNEILKNSLLYRYLTISNNILTDIRSGNYDAIAEYSKYKVNINIETITRRISHSVSRISKKIGKVIVKAKKDTVERAMGLGKRRLYNVI